MVDFYVMKAPNEELSLTNKLFFNPADFNPNIKFCTIHTESGSYVFKGQPSDLIKPKMISFGSMQRKWCSLSLDQVIKVNGYTFDSMKDIVGNVVLVVDHLKKKTNAEQCYDSDAMAREFTMQFCDTPLTVGQMLLYKFNDILFSVIVKEITTIALNTGQSKQSQIGLIGGNSTISFEKPPNALFMLTGKSCKTTYSKQSVISMNWDFKQLGIGGLDKEFSDIFRRTFASRMFPPELTKQLGLKHVRGMLLYGPPGTGKTLMARQIGSMLNAREPKIVNGPSILDKYVGESEANIRKLFAEAEEESKRMGVHSGLHIIIFDEIDAICKQRGSAGGGTGVHDTVVNQLLTKIDGVEQLNNILVIGMTNRRDMIDEALLRPGRFEMQMEISLPDENGRLQILQIHTSKMRDAGKLSTDVDLNELAHMTKNFSGAEIEGLCRAAANTAMSQLVNPSGGMELNAEKIEQLAVKRDDFMYALENDIKPMFGTEEEELSRYAPRGIITWGASVSHALDMGQLAVKAVAESDVETYRPLTMLLKGESKAGKTSLAVEIARKSGFPFVKICTTHKMTGFTEIAKCNAMKSLFDAAAKCTYSVVIVDNIEALIEYNPVGPRFSNFMVQAIKDLVTQPLKARRRMLVIGTTSCYEALKEQNLTQAFSWTVHVHMISTADELNNVLEEDDRIPLDDRRMIHKHLQGHRLCIGIKQVIDLIDLVSKSDASTRVASFLSRMEEEGAICN